MKQTKNFLDLLSEEGRAKAIERAQKRNERTRSRKGQDISPEIYMVSEFGYHFGWDAMLAIRRGYTVEPVTGDKEVFTLEEAQVLLEGAKKVWYTKLIEQGHATLVATNSSQAKNPGESFNKGVKPFAEAAEVKA